MNYILHFLKKKWMVFACVKATICVLRVVHIHSYAVVIGLLICCYMVSRVFWVVASIVIAYCSNQKDPPPTVLLFSLIFAYQIWNMLNLHLWTCLMFVFGPGWHGEESLIIVAQAGWARSRTHILFGNTWWIVCARISDLYHAV